MSKLCFLTNNLIEDANMILNVGVANAQFPLSNIKLSFTTKTFRSIGNSVEIIIDLGSTLPADTVMICGDAVEGTLGFNNASLKGSGSLDFSSSTSIPLDVSHKFNISLKQFTQVSHRYWLLTLTGTTYVEVSNIYLGIKTTLPQNDIDLKSFSWGQEDRSKIQENLYGQKYVDEYNTTQYLSGQIKLITGPEYGILRDIWTAHRKIKPLWFILDPEDKMSIVDSYFEFSGYYRINKDFSYTTAAFGYYDVGISLEENV